MTQETTRRQVMMINVVLQELWELFFHDSLDRQTFTTEYQTSPESRMGNQIRYKFRKSISRVSSNLHSSILPCYSVSSYWTDLTTYQIKPPAWLWFLMTFTRPTKSLPWTEDLVLTPAILWRQISDSSFLSPLHVYINVCVSRPRISISINIKLESWFKQTIYSQTK